VKTSWKTILLGTLIVGVPVAFLIFFGVPRFQARGALTLDGAPFQPTSCSALRGKAGVRLASDGGAALTIALPVAPPGAFQTVSGVPRVSVDLAPGPAADLGTCGQASLRGEGWHGEGKRAAGGHLALDCGGAHRVTGDLEISGCF
jgi:hypothetical protein